MRSANIITTLILTLQFLNTTTLDEKYYKNPSGPKCCRSGSHYTLKNDTLTCSDTYINHIYYQEPLTAKNYSRCYECVYRELKNGNSSCNQCMDVVSSEYVKDAYGIETSCNACLQIIENKNDCHKCLQLGATEAICEECMKDMKNKSRDEISCNDCFQVIKNKSGTNKSCDECINDESNKNEFEKSKSCDECIEVMKKAESGEINIIKVDCNGDHTILDQHNFYPKCCPIGYLYNPTEHKCVKNGSSNPDFVGYIRVDLSNCKSVIVDYLDVQNYTIDPISLAVSIKIGNEEVGSDSVDNFIIKKILENNSKRVYKYGDYCWDKDFISGGKVLRACVSSSVCKSEKNLEGITCVPKCCSDGHHFLKGCSPTYTHGINSSILGLNKDFAIIKAKPKTKHIPPLTDPTLDEFGVLSTSEGRYTPEEYCLEQHNNVQKIFLFSGNEPAVETVKFYLRKIMVTISCNFLFLTLVCYVILAEMRENLYGKCVMIYCSIFLLGFILLTYMNFQSHNMDKRSCFVIGFLLIFSFLGTFSWLNIICFDMWMAFGQIHVRTLRSRRNTCKKLIYYNLYGWGIPTSITLLIFGMSKASWIPDYLRPTVGQKECFIQKERGNYSHLVYFIVPIAILVISNFVLFLKTISYCFKVKDEINKMIDTLPSEKAKRNKSLNADKEKLAMMIKLFVIMGISWLLEILASFISFKQNIVLSYIELIMDCVNSLQGFFIFCILLLKKKVLTSLKNKVFPTLIRRTSQSSTTMTSVYSYIRKKDNVNPNRNTSETRH